MSGARPPDPGVRSATLTRIPALDGMRAIAVLAVLLFHAGLSWIQGGTLGVDVFFVLSGFLITALLVAERDRSGHIGLGAFYLRRARRLLPALVLVLLFVGIIWGLLLSTKTPTLRGDVLATLGYVANWRFAFTGQGYFASFNAPSPLLHTWSLAVEEQFYLLWPLVVIVLLRRGRSVSRWAAFLVAASFASTLIQSLAGVWTDRLYYGTDTRAMPLLLGAVLGAWYVRRDQTRDLTPAGRTWLQVAGVAAAVGTLYCFHAINGQATFLYRGGFLLIAALVVVVIAAVALVPSGPLARLLGMQPLRYLGQLSYGIYLWHWPLFLLLNHERTGLGTAGLLAVRLAVTLAVSMASYHLIELPIRERRLRLPRPKVTAPVAIAALVGVLVAATPPPAPLTPPTAVNAPPADTSIKSSKPPGTSRVLFVGDSVALALADVLSRSEIPYDVHIDNAGYLGCGIAIGSPRRFRGKDSDDPSFCPQWPQRRAQEVAQDRPDLVAVLVGEWELMDRVWHGQWVHIGEPAYDAYLGQQLDLMINVASARGAKVALLTAPCSAPAESPSGALWPENDPARLARFNELLREAAARHAAKATVVDLKAIVCPGGKYVTTLDGYLLRSSDGIHFPLQAIPPLAAKVLPTLRSLAVEKQQSKTPG
ncbi:MAG TPA: acyltransferase family protein [Frankiaceae bacterium]|nr:acyltransferase family protein [Frankiaceae bacterium]